MKAGPNSKIMPKIKKKCHVKLFRAHPLVLFGDTVLYPGRGQKYPNRNLNLVCPAKLSKIYGSVI